MPRIGRALSEYDLVCFSHLRWNFVFQRPQHLLTRFAVHMRVFYFEEPVEEDVDVPALRMTRESGVTILTPVLPPRVADGPERDAAIRRLVDECLARHRVDQFVLWYYTPMALAFSRHLSAAAVVFDCMDELSAFAQAPPALRAFESELLRKANVVFTGGHSLYEAKRSAHHNVHAVPSSVDVDHFATARRSVIEPADQAHIGRPRLGYFGVIDERMDLDLLAAVADARPEWHIVMVGPFAKIDPAVVPHRANIHYLGGKAYEQLPTYVASWNVALMPFARNEATRFISPTKTPEYMAAGKPVVSTSIHDVVRPYGERGLVRIADEPAGFVAACEAALEEDPVARMARADAFLKTTSWNRTWERMERLLVAALPHDGAATPVASETRPTALAVVDRRVSA
jgi:UDP-galactopyranose mutase